MIKRLLIFIIIPCTLWAEDTKYGGAFLELGIGPRALALGNAYVALAEDGSGFYWNPGAMAFITQMEASAMYANLFNSLENHGYINFTLPVFGGVILSASWIRLAVDDIPRMFDENLIRYTREQRMSRDRSLWLTALPQGSFSFTNNAYFFTFAKLVHWKANLGWQYFELPIDFGYGINFKWVDLALDDKKGNGIGVDAGIKVKLGLQDLFNSEYYGDLSFGVSSQDLLRTRLTWNTDTKHQDIIERSWRYGLAYIQPLNFLSSDLVLAYDIYTKYQGSGHLGVEYIYRSMFALRLGSNAGAFTAGAGIAYWHFRLDYAYQGHDDLGNSHRVGIGFRF
jgi:hypothetical protein